MDMESTSVSEIIHRGGTILYAKMPGVLTGEGQRKVPEIY